MSYLGIGDLHTNPAIFIYELYILRYLLCKSITVYIIYILIRLI